MTGLPRRVVVTGIGLVTPLGTDAATTFQGLVRGRSGLVPLRRAPFFLPGYLSEDKKLSTQQKKAALESLIETMPCRVVGAVVENNEDEYYYDSEQPDSVSRRKALRFAPTSREPRGFRFCEKAVDEALRDALLLHPSAVEGDLADAAAAPEGRTAAAAATKTLSESQELIGLKDPRRIGVNIGMGIPSLSDVTDVTAALTGDLLKPSANDAAAVAVVTATSEEHGKKGKKPSAQSPVHYSKINPFFVPKILGNMAAGVTAIRYNCQGFVSSSVAACATGAHCIGEGFLVLQQRRAFPEAATRDAFERFLRREGSGDPAPPASPSAGGEDGESDGIVDVMICGATEACITPVSLGGFARMRALGTKHNECGAGEDGGPATAARPFDVSRDGFIMGEGAGILILEEYEHAKRRIAAYLRSVQENPLLSAAVKAEFGKKSVLDFIYGEVKGFGVSCDAHHVAAPHPSGRGAEACLRNCLASGNVFQDDTKANSFYTATYAPPPPSTASGEEGRVGEKEEWRAVAFEPLRIGYINAHATGTIGDEIEIGAIRRVFVPQRGTTTATATKKTAEEKENEKQRAGTVYVSSSKGGLGHLLGAAGSVEAAVALLALKHQVAPPTANLSQPCVPHAEQQREAVVLNEQAVALERCEAVVSTSFGFGGINTALLFSTVGRGNDGGAP